MPEAASEVANAIEVQPGHPFVGDDDHPRLRQQRPEEIRGCCEQSLTHEDVVRAWSEIDVDRHHVCRRRLRTRSHAPASAFVATSDR